MRLLYALLAALVLLPGAAAQSLAAAGPDPVLRAATGLDVPAPADRSQARSRAVQATFTVTTAADAGAGSLREAIALANASPGLDAIVFAIDGGGSYQEVFLQTELPILTDPVTLDGATQGCDTSEGLCVRLDGGAIPDVEDYQVGLGVAGGGSTLRGVAFTRFFPSALNSAVALLSSDNTVAGCYFGTDRTGRVTDPDGTPGSGDELGNGFGIGVQELEGATEATGNLIGGYAAADRNVLSGNTFSGISIRDATTRQNQVLGNYVGTNVDGTAALPNGFSGIIVGAGAHQNTFEDNLLSGNTNAGIKLQENANDNVVIGNRIGTDADGASAIPNGTPASLAEQEASGVSVVGASGTLILGNLISGNLLAGVVLGTVVPNAVISETVVQGNRIGTDITGTQPIPNGVTGVENTGFGIVMFAPETVRVSDNVIGGSSMEDGNVIGFNTTAGIGAQGGVFGNVIDHNYIGIGPDNERIPNGVFGVLLRNFASGNLIGSDELSDEPGNLVGFQPIGIGVGANSAQDAVGFNRFAGPAGTFLPIDLGHDGPTANDAGDADAGPNRLQNAPVIEAAPLSGGEVTVRFRVDSAPAHAAYPLSVLFYTREAFDGLWVFIPFGAASYTEAEAQTHASATFDPDDLGDDPGAVIVAMAIDDDGNASEMSLAGVGVAAGDGPGAEDLAAWVAPNPTAGRAGLSFDLGEPADVTAELFDLLGRRVATLADGPLGAGAHTVRLEAGRLPAGMYLWRLRAGGRVETGPLTVVR